MPKPERPDGRASSSSATRRRRQPEKNAGAPAVTIPAFNPVTSYTKLAHPDIAKRVGLTDEQRAQLSATLSERFRRTTRDCGRRGGGVAGEAGVRTESSVNCSRRNNWRPGRIRSSSVRFGSIFRFQLWTDVLEWFAEESGPVVGHETNPPPGTFNYSDPKQYTPEEAIDVLNSVLLTHGFTLIRRDKMLIVQGPVSREYLTV